MNAGSLAASAALLLAAPPVPQVGRDPIGGYWEPGTRPRPAPADGAWEIAVGAALLSLGVIGAGAAGAGVWATDARRCDRVTGLAPDRCRGLYVFSWVRVAYGILLAGGGVGLLVVGGRRRARRRRFDAMRDFSLRAGPSGVAVAGRFGWSW